VDWRYLLSFSSFTQPILLLLDGLGVMLSLTLIRCFKARNLFQDKSKMGLVAAAKYGVK